MTNATCPARDVATANETARGLTAFLVALPVTLFAALAALGVMDAATRGLPPVF